ncbi:MAG: glycosyltransferase family 2 protein [Sediminibacterium sp.]|nr:glycosyltransferase family 2 protein [Chitinophagaceae bacterium]MCA6447461.1 glycosyltransferase family 2 protein [Chitinophagaceae bacterium]
MLSIIIINYRSAQHIENLLLSAKQFPIQSLVEWIVVDNASGDDSEQVLCTKFPFLRWENMGYNAGFARANNRGMQIAKGNIFLLLNPDTLLVDNAIDQCYQKFIHDTYAAAGVQLIGKDGSFQIPGSFFVKGGVNHLLPIPYWGSFLKWVAFLFQSKKPHVLLASEEEKVDWISGAFLMVKKAVVNKVGMMDEDFFLYGEEVEWCSRLVREGGCCIYGDCKIIHLEGQTITAETGSTENSYTNIFDKKGLQLILSNHLRIRKQYGIGWLLFQLFNYSFGVLVFAVAGFLHNMLQYRNPFSHARRWVGYTKNVCMVWGYLPRLLLNRPYFYKVI